MQFVDFFAGIGGIRLGLEQAGHKCVGFCEFDKYARTAYKAIFDDQGRKNKQLKPMDICPTLRAQSHGNEPKVFGDNIRIRRLTPRECWRLQGFPDEYFDKAKAAGISDTQLYKQAGNSVSVPVAKAIGERLKEVEEHGERTRKAHQGC